MTAQNFTVSSSDRNISLAYTELSKSGPISFLDLLNIIDLSKTKQDLQESIINKIIQRLQNAVSGMTSPHPISGIVAIRSAEVAKVFLNEYETTDSYTLATKLNLILQESLVGYFKFYRLPSARLNKTTQEATIYVFCQAWEYYSSTGATEHGYTLHLTINHWEKYMDDRWGSRPDKVPSTYVAPAVYMKPTISIVEIPGNLYVNLLQQENLFITDKHPVWLDFNEEVEAIC